MWFLLPIALGAGYVVRLIVAPAVKSEVVAYSTDSNFIGKVEQNLKVMGIDYEIDTDGVNSWVMVTPDNRVEASKAVNTARALPAVPTNE